MSTSRALMLGRAISMGLNSKLGTRNSRQIVRNMSGHTWYYRTGPTKHSKKTTYGAQMVGGLMWWWIMWHLWHEPEHLFGEFPYPDVSKWTNAELGIPPDDYDEE